MKKIHFRPRLILVLLVPVLLIASFLLFQYQDAQISWTSEKCKRLESMKGEMLTTIEEKERKLEFSKSDDWIERIARTDLGLVMPDEILYVEHYPD